MNKDIAIIGMAGRFPDARNLDELFVNLAQGRDSVREISRERLESTTLPLDKEYRICGYLEDVDKFDHHFFNISLAEAQTMEPNQRVLLEVVYEIFDNSAYSIDDFNGTNTCVYVAEAGNDYYKHADKVLPTLITGNAREFLAARIARQFNLRGTAAMVNTSCSSALAAVHLACNELKLKDADYALVCAVNIDLFPYKDNSMTLGLLSPDGKSRAFSARANGMSRGETAAGVLLKPLDKAIKDKDIIHAIIKGSAVNNNAQNSASLSAPDSQTQAEVIRKAWENAGINPMDIGFIEAHGSGTELGDSLEIEGLDLAFQEYTDKKKFCPISTIKSNVGHGVFASGMSGLIKAVLSLKQKVIFPTIHFDAPNPLIDFEQSAVYVNDILKRWEVEEGKTRIAGVSSIGFSGTNCHMILQESPSPDAYGENKSAQGTFPWKKDYLVTVSSKTPEGLRKNLDTLLQKLDGGNSYRLSDISYTLNKGRKHYNYRFACIADHLDNLKRQVAEVAAESIPRDENHKPPAALQKLIFIFSDHEERADSLFSFFLPRYPLFEKYVRQCSVYGANPRDTNFRDFAFQYSFYKLLEDYGIITENVLAVGIGKIIVDVISGDITLDEAINRVISYKGETIAGLEGRVKYLIQKETGDQPTAFIDLGPGGAISRELENQDTGDGRFFVFRLPGVPGDSDPFLELLKYLYLVNYTIDRDLFFKHHEGQKIELSGYQFQRIRCWLREEPAVFTGDVRPAVSDSYPLYETGSEIEEKIAGFWREVLGVEKFYLEDDFFARGGDSLKATKVIRRINQAFMFNLDFEDIFDFPTIKSLGEYIDSLLSTQQKMALTWKEVLKVQQVEEGDHFFELGGHSLLATQVLNRVKKEFHLELNFEDFFQHPTLGSLSRYIDNLLAEGKNRIEYRVVQPVEKKDHYLLSSAQKRFYLLQHKEKENTSYNGTQVLVLEGELQVERLEATFRKLMWRHESLRTSFIMVNGEPRQRVHDNVPFGIDYREAREEEVLSLVEDFIRVFDLAAAPLLRVGLIKVAGKGKQNIFMVDVHHIISDGTSVSILVKDFMLLYRGKEGPTLPGLQVQYKDFSEWQANAREADLRQQQENYWLNIFADDLPVLALNTDYPRSSVPVTSYEGNTVSFQVDAKTRKGLRDIEKRTGATLFMILVAAYNILLMKHSAQEDIIVGTLANGRAHTDLEGIIGVFVETLAMRNKPTRIKPFVDFLQEVKENSLNAFKYSGYPFEELLKKVQFIRELNRNPLFDTMLLLQNYEHTAFVVEGLVCRPYTYKKNTLFFDIRLIAVEKGEEIEIEIDYARKLFKSATIQRFAGHYVKLLGEVAHNYQTPLGEIEILTEKEKEQILVEFNDTQKDVGKRKVVSRLFEEQVLKTPGNAALFYKDKEISYRGLNEQANHLARRLLTRGLQTGQPVGILMSPSPLMVSGIFAVWKAGGTYIPIDPKYPTQRITEILADSAVEIVLSQQNPLPPGLEKVCTFDRIMPNLPENEVTWGIGDSEESATNLEAEPSQGHPAYIIYTSGSTGTPKGAGVYHGGFTNLIAWFVSEFGINANDRNVLVTSMSFDLTQKNIFAPLVTGGTLTIPGLNYFEPGVLLQTIGDKRITWLNCTPGIIYKIIEFSDMEKLEKLASLRYLFLGGEPISMKRLGRWIESCYFNAEIVNTYGPTECTDICASYRVTRAETFYEDAIPIGKPIYNTRLYVLDPSFQLLPVGVPGELCIGGKGVGSGYLNNPELTVQKFDHDNNKKFFGGSRGAIFQKSPPGRRRPKIYKTGDLARWLADGNIEYLGRIDLQVKVRGFRIELEEIENRLLKHEKINAAVVVVLDRSTHSPGQGANDKYLCAYYTSGEELPVPGLREYLALRLPHYMIPSSFMRLDKIPLTPHGKVDRRSLPKPDIETAGLGTQYLEAGKMSEKKLVEIWQEVLGIDKIGIWDNFFELGGDSLLVIQVIARIREEFHVELPVKKFFEQPFIKALSGELAVLETRGDSEVTIKPAPRDRKIPLSFAQERLWFLQQLDPRCMAYHVPRTIRIKGNLEVTLLERTFTEIIHRHEILRTVFPAIDGKPVQCILEPFPLRIPVLDLKGIGEQEQNQRVSELILEEGQRTFDFEKGPLLRALLLKLQEKEHLLLLTEHHLVHDGWTQGVLLGEFLALYKAYAGGQPSPLPDLPIQYADFAYWQRHYLQGEELEKHLDYWRQKLSGLEPVLNLPLDRPRPAVMSGRGAEQRLMLSKQLSDALKQFSHKNEVTLFMTMLAAFKALLYRYTGTGDLCVGTGMANRRYKELEGMLGMVINTLALRTLVSGELSFSQCAHRVKDTCLEAYAHEDTPFEKIVEVLQPERCLSYTPIFQVLYSFLDTPAQQLELPGLELHIEPSHNRSAKFDINIIVLPEVEQRGDEFDGGIEILWEYSTDIFDDNSTERMLRHYKRLLEESITNPKEKISALPIMEDQEINQILYDFNNTGVDYPREKTLHQLFEEQVGRTPAKTALVGNRQLAVGKKKGTGELTQLTYRELNKKSDQLAHWLRGKGVKTDNIVALLLGRSLDMIIGILGILKAGGAYLPIDADYPQARINYMLKDSGTKFLLSSEPHPDLPSSPHPSLSLHLSPGSATAVSPSSTLTSTCQESPGNLAYIIYTSGTTGKPKGMLIEHKNVVRLLFNDQFQFDFDHRDVWTLFHSYCFDFSVWEMYGALLYSGKLIIIPKMAAQDTGWYLEMLKAQGVTVLNQTPSAFYHLINEEFKHDRGELRIKYIIFGGEALNPGKLKEWKKRYPGTELVNMFGITETTVHITFKEITGRDIQLNKSNIGKPLPTLSTHVMDKNLQLVPPGVVGEICVGGEGIGRGYLNRIELTKKKFIQNPYIPGGRLYKSGDLGRVMNSGEMEYIGRMDQQVKIRGYRIEVGEIESQLMRYSHIKEWVVIPKQDKMEDRYLCAYFVSDKEMDIPGLRNDLFKILPDYMIPAFFIRLENIPMTPNGKVDRKALPEPEPKAGEDYLPPRNETEKKLVEIWSVVLGRDAQHISQLRDTIGMDANFFQIGGHSLKAAALISRIHKELGMKVPLAEIFKRQSLGELAAYIRHIKKSKYQGIEPVEKKEYYGLSSAQKRLFFIQGMDLDNTSYNIPMVLYPGKDIEKEKLEKALLQLIARHESLRASFEMINDVPVQRVHDEVEFKMEYFLEVPFGQVLDSPGGREGESAISTIKNFVRPFDLSQSPLLRSRLIKLPGGNHTWIIDLHHIISDGTSNSMLAEDFAALYNGEELAPLRVQYKDFSEWQNRLFRSGEIETQENYWLNLYSGEIPKLHLPTDYKRPAVFTFSGDNCHFSLRGQEAVKLKALSARTGGTLYMNTLAALNVLFYKYTGQTDIIIGSGIAGRMHADLQPIIGMFVNTLAMRNYPSGEKTYEVLLKEVIDNSIKAFENQDMQFEELVDRLEPERDTSRNPLFDIMMVVQNFRQVGEGLLNEKMSREMEKLFLGEDDIPYVGYNNYTSKFDMTFFVYETGGEVFINVEYYTGIFKRESIIRFIEHFKKIVRTVTANPGVRLKEIEIITEQEKQQLLYKHNHTRTDYPRDKTIVWLFTEQVEKTPDHMAVVRGEEHLTFGELDRQSNRVAHFLYGENNVRIEPRLGILMDSSLAMMAALPGILKAGGAYVPLSPRWPEERIKRIINEPGIGILLGQRRYIKTMNRLQWECPCLNTFLCIDSEDVHGEAEGTNELMNPKLWDYVGETSVDEVTGGGWKSSYTGNPIPKEEMDEYSDNILKKLEPLLHKNMRVLEIGVGSGISMYRIAPRVKMYHGTDLSGVIIEKNQARTAEQGHKNIRLSCLAAHEIHQIQEKNFDLVIINSVIQCFNGHNYLRNVLHKAINLMASSGYLFVGDIMDQDLKDDLIKDLQEFKQENKGKNYKTKLDWSEELFISRSFLEDLIVDIPEIYNVKFSNKIHTLENELTKFRYDALIYIDREGKKTKPGRPKHKNQYDMMALRKTSTRKLTLNLEPNHLAYIIYTSGSTGIPKGVMAEHGNVVRLVKNTNFIDFRNGDRILQTGALDFDASTFEIWGAWLNGLELHIEEKNRLLSPGSLKETVNKSKITTMWMTSPFFNRMLEAEIEIFAPLRNLLVGGDALSPYHINQLRNRFPGLNIINGYGPTENVTFSTTHLIAATYQESIPIGKPIANSFAYVVDRNCRLVPVGVPGELLVGGDGVSRGYLNDIELTAEKFDHDLWDYRDYHDFQKKETRKKVTGKKNYRSYIYRTGDLVKRLPDGNLEFLGRMDNQVKVRGYRIELGEIESQLLNCDRVKEAVVMVRVDSGGGKYLSAYIVSDEDVDAAEINEMLAYKLPEYMIPSFILQLEKIPLTPNGKVDRKALPEPGMKVSQDYIGPGDEIESKLVDIWSQVLGIGREVIGIDSDFFELGGHSLKATTLVSLIHKRFNAKVPLVEVFRNPFIRELAQYIRQAAEERFSAIEVVEKREYYALSSVQKRLYILQQMDKSAVHYNIPTTALLEGELDRERLEKTFQKLIHRHESLRTSFVEMDGKLVQVILEDVEFEIEGTRGLAPLSKNPAERKAQSAERKEERHAPCAMRCASTIKNFIRSFDLSRAPLMRVGLAKTGETRHLLIVDIHHIVTDGISMNILVKEFMQLYRGERLPRLRIQYKDFSRWQNRLLESEELKMQEDYWLKEFIGDIPVLDLPLDFERPARRSVEGRVIGFNIDEPATAGLKQIAREEGATLYTVLLALYNVFLSKISIQEDIVIGTSVAGRRHADLEPVIGMFVNTLALRNRPLEDKTFREFLHEVGKRTIEAFNNQDYQFESLVEKVVTGRKANRNSLLDVRFSFHNEASPEDISEMEIPGLKLIPCKHENTTVKSDITLQAIERDDKLVFEFEYSTKLFKRETIERFVDYFKKILSCVLEDMDIRLRDIEISHGLLAIKHDVTQIDLQF